jgi:hypothetical protein
MRELDLSRLRRTSLHARKSKVSFRGFAAPVRKGMSLGAFLAGLPDYLAARDFRAVVDSGSGPTSSRWGFPRSCSRACPNVCSTASR